MGEYSISLIDSIKIYMSKSKINRKDSDNFLRKMKEEKEPVHTAFVEVLTKLNQKLINGQQIKINNQQVYRIMLDVGVNSGIMIEESVLFDRNLFQLTAGQDWRWIMPYSQFKHYYRKVIQEFYPNNMEFFFKRLNIQESRSAFGSLYKLALIDCVKKTIKKKKKLIITSGNQRYCISKVCQFIELKSSEKDQDEEDNILKILSTAKKNPSKFVFVIPTKSNDNIRFCVDFALVSYSKSEKKFKVHFYDVESGDALDKKKNNSIQKLQEIFKSKIGRIQHDLKFYVLTIEKGLRKKDQDKFTFSDILGINFKGDDEAMEKMKVFQKILRKIQEKVVDKQRQEVKK